jgi:threonine synthase
LQRIRADFACGYATDEAGAVALCGCWEQNRYLMDTHTAVAWDVAQRTADKDVPCVVLSTASPYKFPCDVLSALRGDAPLDEFEAMAQLEALTGVPAPRSLADLRAKAVRFDTVIAKEDIGAVALRL